MNLHRFSARLLLLSALVLSACASLERGTAPAEATAAAYAAAKTDKGVVLMGISWARHWPCGTYENAELMSLGFDRLPISGTDDTVPPQVFFDGPPRLTKGVSGMDYALLLAPGDYALTSFKIKAAKSVSDVGFFNAKRSKLFPAEGPQAGTFQVRAGEAVYIGHFALDCTQQEPLPWRYYSKDREGFASYLASMRQAYPFLDLSNVQYRLFSTKTLGYDYQLPP